MIQETGVNPQERQTEFLTQFIFDPITRFLVWCFVIWSIKFYCKQWFKFRIHNNKIKVGLQSKAVFSIAYAAIYTSPLCQDIFSRGLS